MIPNFNIFETEPEEVAYTISDSNAESYIILEEKLTNKPAHDFGHITAAIEKSKYILDLDDDWDDAGSPKYDTNVWQAAVDFLRSYSKQLYQFNIKIEAPRIYNAPNGSIDLLWENDKRTILINITANAEDAIFYADDNIGHQKNKGSFKLSAYMPLLIPIPI
jgi:hypothetical protein